MPRKKKKKIVKSNSSRIVTKRRYERKESLTSKWTSSYSSLLLGIVAVIVAVLFVVSFIKQQNHQQTSSIATGPTPTTEASPTPGSTLQENGQTYYIVKANDSLWTIADTNYHDGYQWVKIAKANNQLAETLRSLFAVSENYPKLRANENFLSLQEELTDTENKIAYARQFYNSTVMDYNTKLLVFPTNVFAGMLNFKSAEFFAASEDEKKEVAVKF